MNNTASNKPITINGIRVKAGEQRVIDLPIAKLNTHTNTSISIHVMCGKKAGPRLFISAAIHGDELNGIEISRRLIKTTQLKHLRGTLIVVPIVNLFGTIQRSRYLPDRRDLNRCFPGSSRGSMAARLAHVFFKNIVKQCDYGIDLHTGAIHRTNLPHIRADLDDAETKSLAEAFSVPVILDTKLPDGSLREAASAHGVKVLLYEAGEALRFDELSIRAGVRGILSVMRILAMLKPLKTKEGEEMQPFITHSSNWVRASASGVFRYIAPLGGHVEKGELLGVISNPSNLFDSAEYEVRAHYAGLIIGRNNIPLVNEGDALFHIARFENINEVATMTKAFQNTADNIPNPIFGDQRLT